jgi:hypothetical protein
VAESSSTHISENTPDGVALKLLYAVAHAEGKSLWSGSTAPDKPDRKWIFDTFSECLRTVRQP